MSKNIIYLGAKVIAKYIIREHMYITKDIMYWEQGQKPRILPENSQG